MPTTASTSADERSDSPNVTKGLAGWLAVAGLQIVLSFGLRSTGGDGDEDVLYRYELAISSLVFYGILLVVTLWIASAFRDRRDALGLRGFAPRWLGITVAVVIASAIVARVLEPVLHAGEEQGFAPDVWRPDRATAFVVNAVVITTLVPFAEELFFRGLGVRALSAFGGLFAVVGTALIFGFAHGILVALPPLVFFALGLAWVRLRSQSVWPGVIAHSVYNGIGILYVYVTLQ